MGGYGKNAARIRAAEEVKNALAAKPRSVRNALVAKLRDTAAGLTEGVVGVPGTPWGELMNAAMAGGRSILPGGGTYADELQNVREAREERYPGAYSEIPEVRNAALWRAASEETVASGAGMAAPIAFHGSPHAWSRFSMQKLGTGEGVGLPELVSDHGWGGYFAKSGKTADQYRATLTGENMRLDGRPAEALPTHQADVLDAIGARVIQGQSLEQALSGARAWLRSVGKSNPRAYAKAAAFAEEVTPERLSGTGHFYEVDLPDDLLHTSEPLSRQLDPVKQRLSAAGIAGDITGEQLYKQLTEKLGSKEAASRYLASIGVPGHVFQTRAGPEIVMYDENAIKTLGRYPSLADFLKAKTQTK